MEEKVPLFSIIVPIYNNEHDLQKCIESILAQSYEDFELILVNDGSTDKSPQICDRYENKDIRVKVIHKEKNGGVVAARNDGLFQASGKYIYYVDGDDWISEELLENASEVLSKENPPDIYAFSHIVVQKDKYVKKEIKVEEGMYDRERLEKTVFPELICKVKGTIKRGNCSAALWDKIIAKELLEKHYCKDTSLFRGEDSVCSLECMYYADKVYFSKLPMYYYNRISINSSMKKYHPNLYEDNKAVAEYLRNHLKEGEEFQIKRQIKASEFRGLVAVIHQEISHKHAVYSAARFLRQKCRGEKFVFSCEGIRLPIYVYPYVTLLNLRCFEFLLLCGIAGYLINDILCLAKRCSIRIIQCI